MRVKYRDSIEYKALSRIKRIRGHVVLRDDLDDLGSYRQVSRVFKALMSENKLIKIGAGIYAKTTTADKLDTPVLNVTFRQLCKEALTRKGIEWESGTAEREYNEGLSTQVPARTVIRLKSRFRGQLTYGKQKLIAEKGINAR